MVHAHQRFPQFPEKVLFATECFFGHFMAHERVLSGQSALGAVKLTGRSEMFAGRFNFFFQILGELAGNDFEFNELIGV